MDLAPAESMHKLLATYGAHIKRALVVGSENPWVEYELFKAGLEQVWTFLLSTCIL
jgi:hypothetical protein